jgi:ribosome recycling factor
VSDELTELVIEEADEKMAKAIERVQHEFAGVRTGRANSGLVEHLLVDYYGTPTPLRQIAAFSVPEARLLVISPFDKASMGAIEKAIQSTDLGLSPSNDGVVMRLAFPALTEERRRDFVKIVRNKAEEGKVALRNIRRSARHDLDVLVKDEGLSTDVTERAEAVIQKMTDAAIDRVDALLAQKEAELLEV